MKNVLRSVAAALVGLAMLWPTGAAAQSVCPAIVNGAVLTAGQWNACFAAKNNTLGYTPVNKAGDIMLGRFITLASSTSFAGLNVPQGVAPNAPVNGDIWATSANLFVRINGVTVALVGATSASFAAASPITVSFPAGVVTYAFDFSVANTFLAQQTNQGATTTSPGWYAQVSGDTTPRVRVGMNATDVPSVAFGPGNAVRDTFIERLAAASLRFGAPDAAAPVAQTLGVQNVVAGTSNTAGANLTINGSRGTGTGVGGSLIFQVAPAGSTGSAQNALAAALTIDSTKLATFAAGASFTGNVVNNSGYIWVKSQLLVGSAGNAIQATSATLTNIMSPSANDTTISLGLGTTSIISHLGAADPTIQFGLPDAALPVAQTTRVQSVVAGTAAANGANWTLIGSLPTGTGTSGDIIFQTGVKTGSGTTQGTPTTALTIKGETQEVQPGADLRLVDGNKFYWASRAAIDSTADGQIRLLNHALNGFTSLQFGGISSSFPSIKRNLTALNFRLADDSADAPITASTLALSGALTSGNIVATTTSPSALAVGPGGTTSPTFLVDASSGSAVTGIKIKGAAVGGGVAMSVITSGTNENLNIDAAGAGNIAFGATSTGAIQLDRATTLSAALTYGGVTLSNAVTGTGSMVLGTSPTIASLTVTGAFTATGLVTNADLVNASTTVNGQTCTLGSTCTIVASAGSITIGTTIIVSGTTTRILFDNAGVIGEYTITGTGTVVAMAAGPTFTGSPVLSTPTATSIAVAGCTIGADGVCNAGSETITGLLKLGANLRLPNAGVIYPASDSTTALYIAKADATTKIVTVDSTNARVGINKTPGAFDLDVNGAANVGGAFSFGSLSATSMGGSTVTITGLTANNSPSASNDYFLYYSAADGAIRKCTVGACSSAGASGVTSVNALTGALTIAAGAGISVGAAGSTVTITNTQSSGGPGGRLTLVSGVPVMVSNQTAKTTIYYDTYVSNTVTVYNGTNMVSLTIGSDEISMGLDTTNHANATVYDVYGVSNSGTLVICTGPAWTSTTGRGTGAGTTELQLKNGVWTNKNSLTHCYGGAAGTTDYGAVSANQGTYVGSFYTTAAGQTGMSYTPTAASGGAAPIMALFNAYNRVPTTVINRDSVSSWSGGGATWRKINGNANNDIKYLDGLAVMSPAAAWSALVNVGGVGTYGAGIMCAWSSGAPPFFSTQDNTQSSFQSERFGMTINGGCTPALGLQAVSVVEFSTGTVTIYGTGGPITGQTEGFSSRMEM